MLKKIAIHWFRQDLRIADNPALTNAAHHACVLPIYILDDKNSGEYQQKGSASRWWLHHSLCSLNLSLAGQLSVYRGDPIAVFTDIIARFKVETVYWNRCYEPSAIERDTSIKAFLKTNGITVTTTNGSLLWEPWAVKKTDGTPYKVFTPFYHKGCLPAPPPRSPLPAPDKLKCCKDSTSIGINALKLLPQHTWHKKLEQHWQAGEEVAHQRLENFVAKGLAFYKEGRDFPSKPHVSKLSPHLHFGEVSPNQLWHRVKIMGDTPPIEHFCRELGWREFSYSLLYHHPTLPLKNLQTKFDAFAWADNPTLLQAWQTGKTGVPMVDAGMRQLWQTGYMHNRVRMVVGSFLVKNLRLHWCHGQRWFWDTLVDADLANNSASWQWVAGCGADAAPYFRIFNPVTQGIKFDPNGDYIRQFIPEIARLSDKYLFAPWNAPADELQKAGITIGRTYPAPIVDIKQSRRDALAAFQLLRS